MDYESKRFKFVSIEIDEKDMLALQNDPEIEFVDLNLERSIFPPIKENDFYIVGAEGLEEDDKAGKTKPEKEPDVKNRRRLAETVPYGIESVQADEANGVPPGPFAGEIKVCVVDT